MLIGNLAASDVKLSRSHQKALWTWDREATTSFERIPLSIFVQNHPVRHHDADDSAGPKNTA